MVSREPVLLIVAADRREFASFQAAGIDLTPASVGVHWSAAASLPSGPALLAANGPGRESGALAVRVVCEQVPVRAVVSTGFAGALDPSFQVGDIFVAENVIQFEPRLEYPVRLLPSSPQPAPAVGSLLTIDEVAQTAERKAELRSTGAGAVDMEASAVAAEAQQRGLPFSCIRVISDAAGTSFAIDFNRARRRNGTFSGWRVLGQVLTNPGSWKQLSVLHNDLRTAARALAVFFQKVRFEL